MVQIRKNNLHSNMVRFIILTTVGSLGATTTFTFQYGQIYYEIQKLNKEYSQIHLHSNMVRFIIRRKRKRIENKSSIYIPIWLDLLSIYQNQKLKNKINLHSNMVRFIIMIVRGAQFAISKFTFQYGQIYYKRFNSFSSLLNNIYIPIWLDLLSIYQNQKLKNKINLHSNMVRFIIMIVRGAQFAISKFTFQYGQIYYKRFNSFSSLLNNIYIPIWLDLLYNYKFKLFITLTNLHSNMVRFIIKAESEKVSKELKFTFQYGQIYY